MSANQEIVLFTNDQIDVLERVATNFANSGYFADANKALQAFVKISAGAEMGLLPWQAMQSLHVIKGKLSLTGDYLAGQVKGSAKYDYRILEHTNEVCSIEFREGDEKLGVSTFTMEDARIAGLISQNQNYNTYPRNMLFNRAISNGVAWFCPDVVASRTYTDGELGEPVEMETRPVSEDFAPRAQRRGSAATTTPPRETVIDAEEIVDAAPEIAPSEPTRPETPEGDEAASTIDPVSDQIKACSAMLKSIDDAPRAAIKAALQRLGLGGTLTVGKIAQQLVVMFGPEAAILDHVLVGLNERVQNLSDPHAPIEGEIPSSDDPAAAARFQEWVDEQDARRAEAGERQLAGQS